MKVTYAYASLVNTLLIVCSDGTMSSAGEELPNVKYEEDAESDNDFSRSLFSDSAQDPLTLGQSTQRKEPAETRVDTVDALRSLTGSSTGPLQKVFDLLEDMRRPVPKVPRQSVSEQSEKASADVQCITKSPSSSGNPEVEAEAQPSIKEELVDEQPDTIDLTLDDTEHEHVPVKTEPLKPPAPKAASKTIGDNKKALKARLDSIHRQKCLIELEEEEADIVRQLAESETQ